jgi:hypothetical protein
MAFTIQHTAISSDRPFWYHLECAKDLESACRRAQQYVLDNGGYVCAKDAGGRTVFGTDPIDLCRAISNGTNRHFPRETARRLGCAS